MPTVYKVVRNREGKLVSAIRREGNSRFDEVIPDKDASVITYIPNKVTKPEYGEVFAFKRKFDAVRFGNIGSHATDIHAEVWRAFAHKTRKMSCVAGDCLHESAGYNTIYDKFVSFWSGDLAHSNQMDAPSGTIVCPSLTLLKKVA